ncbi:MAG: hypothetical protein J3K34DRAFT_46 [Monoraphidium minutum]|nr:MAG: hypothetical protein J3K34DRAFT_46 [Monoraphidium minutum]
MAAARGGCWDVAHRPCKLRPRLAPRSQAQRRARAAPLECAQAAALPTVLGLNIYTGSLQGWFFLPFASRNTSAKRAHAPRVWGRLAAKMHRRPPPRRARRLGGRPPRCAGGGGGRWESARLPLYGWVPKSTWGGEEREVVKAAKCSPSRQPES